MTDEHRDCDLSQETETTAAEQTAEASKETEASAATETAEMDRLKEEIRQISDKHMRLMAEYDNYRRRTAQEKDALYSDSIADVVTQWLPVIDNLQRALAAAAQVEEDDLIAQFKQGVEMVLKQALDVMSKQGVEPIEALGKTFDPNLHSAVLHVDDDQYGEQEVVEELEVGYKRGDRVLRHSIVKVAN
jgi:molecular chaperone GrpE